MINLKDTQPSIRRLKEMIEILFDQDWAKKTDPETELYYVWRNVAENEQEKEKIAQVGLRYDITEFAPLTLGKEFNKTYGHSHSLVPGTNLSYSEIYEVLEGQVYFLFQKMDDFYDTLSGVIQSDAVQSENTRMDDTRKGVIKDIFAVHCLAGDKYIVPPGYAHITINPTAKKTVMANWLATASQQSYEEIKQMKGAGYYGLGRGQPSNSSPRGLLFEGCPRIQWVKNQTYPSVPPLRFAQPNNLSQFNISKDQPIYALVNQLEKLDFLKAPQKYSWD